MEDIRERRRCFEVLGLSASASSDDIKKAYKRLALKHHPDKDKSPDAVERFQEINAAYKYLTEGRNAMHLDDDGDDDLGDAWTRIFPWFFENLFFTRSRAWFDPFMDLESEIFRQRSSHFGHSHWGSRRFSDPTPPDFMYSSEDSDVSIKVDDPQEEVIRGSSKQRRKKRAKDRKRARKAEEAAGKGSQNVKISDDIQDDKSKDNTNTSSSTRTSPDSDNVKVKTDKDRPSPSTRGSPEGGNAKVKTDKDRPSPSARGSPEGDDVKVKSDKDKPPSSASAAGKADIKVNDSKNDGTTADIGVEGQEVSGGKADEASAPASAVGGAAKGENNSQANPSQSSSSSELKRSDSVSEGVHQAASRQKKTKKQKKQEQRQREREIEEIGKQLQEKARLDAEKRARKKAAQEEKERREAEERKRQEELEIEREAQRLREERRRKEEAEAKKREEEEYKKEMARLLDSFDSNLYIDALGDFVTKEENTIGGVNLNMPSEDHHDTKPEQPAEYEENYQESYPGNKTRGRGKRFPRGSDYSSYPRGQGRGRPGNNYPGQRDQHPNSQFDQYNGREDEDFGQGRSQPQGFASRDQGPFDDWRPGGYKTGWRRGGERGRGGDRGRGGGRGRGAWGNRGQRSQGQQDDWDDPNPGNSRTTYSSPRTPPESPRSTPDQSQSRGWGDPSFQQPPRHPTPSWEFTPENEASMNRNFERENSQPYDSQYDRVSGNFQQQPPPYNGPVDQPPSSQGRYPGPPPAFAQPFMTGLGGRPLRPPNGPTPLIPPGGFQQPRAPPQQTFQRGGWSARPRGSGVRPPAPGMVYHDSLLGHPPMMNQPYYRQQGQPVDQPYNQHVPLPGFGNRPPQAVPMSHLYRQAGPFPRQMNQQYRHPGSQSSPADQYRQPDLQSAPGNRYRDRQPDLQSTPLNRQHRDPGPQSMPVNQSNNQTGRQGSSMNQPSGRPDPQNASVNPPPTQPNSQDVPVSQTTRQPSSQNPSVNQAPRRPDPPQNQPTNQPPSQPMAPPTQPSVPSQMPRPRFPSQPKPLAPLVSAGKTATGVRSQRPYIPPFGEPPGRTSLDGTASVPPSSSSTGGNNAPYVTRQYSRQSSASSVLSSPRNDGYRSQAPSGNEAAVGAGENYGLDDVDD